MYKTIDLFAGAGGLSFGFEMTGEFMVVAAAENNTNAQKTYVANHRNPELKIIDDVRTCNFAQLAQDFGGIDIVVGGPPCQGFSNANRQKNHIVSMNNSLVKEYFRAIKEIRPRAFVMENVAMLASDTHKFYDSKKDHDEVVELGITMNHDELVITDENYHAYDMMKIINAGMEKQYRIPDELYQLINVLYKNRNNKDRLKSYISRHSATIVKQIKIYQNTGAPKMEILDCISEHITDSSLSDYFEELGSFIKFQRAFRLKQELDDNDIIYDLVQNPITGKIIASVNSYTVYEYVNKILGETYVKNSGVVNSLWFGVPQERRRFIMIGIKKECCKLDSIPMPQENAGSVVTVKDAIFDLMAYDVVDKVDTNQVQDYCTTDNPSEYAKMMRLGATGVSNHIVPKTREKALKRFEVLNEGENFHKLSSDLKDNYADPSRTQNSIYLRLDSSKPSGTVINVRKSMWIHPILNRAISVREAARLQSFPDRFIFKGPKDSQYQQIGNAVPPLMAKGIANHLLSIL